MSFPSSTQELHDLVRAMRQLGVLQAFGVVLGPEPPKLAQLEAMAQNIDDDTERKLELNQAIAEERRNARIEMARAEARDMLAATGKEYSDAQIDAMLDPGVFAP